ncbi:hypothetical protein KY285_023809 [Solanum tuberosum]|nr:hypothetical protein KY285_023809 [Solanum tuberosum]
MLLKEFGEPKRAHCCGQFLGSSSGGMGSYRGSDSFQVESGKLFRWSEGSGRGCHGSSSASHHHLFVTRSCYGCGDQNHKIQQYSLQTYSGPQHTYSTASARHSSLRSRVKEVVSPIEVEGLLLGVLHHCRVEVGVLLMLHGAEMAIIML